MTKVSLGSKAIDTVDEAAFRRACSHFPTGVAIITALDTDGQPIGLTANSFTSAALSPPMVLWTVGPQSRSHQMFLSAAHFAVHVLHSGQHALASHFAGKSEEKFADLAWKASGKGLPILPDFYVCLECRVEEVHPCGNQHLMIGRALKIRHKDHDGALTYFHSTFGSIAKP